MILIDTVLQDLRCLCPTHPDLDNGPKPLNYPALGLALHGYNPTDTTQRRTNAPWYRTKTEPATLDLLTKLRRLIITARFLSSSHRPATPEEILEVQHAWALAAA